MTAAADIIARNIVDSEHAARCYAAARRAALEIYRFELIQGHTLGEDIDRAAASKAYDAYMAVGIKKFEAFAPGALKEVAFFAAGQAAAAARAEVA